MVDVLPSERSLLDLTSWPWPTDVELADLGTWEYGSVSDMPYDGYRLGSCLEMGGCEGGLRHCRA